MAHRSCAAVSVAAAVLACAPNPGAPAAAEPEIAIAVAAAPVLGDGAQLETRCGGLEFVAQGPWTAEDPRLDWLKSAWHPRGEAGRPVAIRSASGPAVLEGHELVELELAHGPQPRMHCYIPQVRELYGDGCVGTDGVWFGFADASARARPDHARAWAELLGTLEGATAVFESNEVLARCTDGVPAAILANTAALGVRGPSEALTVSFVARFDPSPELSMLVVVRASMREGDRGIEREELWTVDRGVSR